MHLNKSSFFKLIFFCAAIFFFATGQARSDDAGQKVRKENRRENELRNDLDVVKRQNRVYIDGNLSSKMVEERVPAELRPVPVQWGGFLVYPKLEVKGVYNDNILAADTDESSDYILTVQPSLKIQKFYGPHFFSFDTFIQNNTYLENKEENTLDYELKANGVIAADNSLEIPFLLSHSKRAIARITPGDSQFTKEPVTSRKVFAETGLEYRFNKLKLGFLGGIARRTFDDGVSELTGQPVVFETENRTTRSLKLTSSYDVGEYKGIPEHRFFADLLLERQRFDDVPDETGIVNADTRDNDKYGLLAGIDTRYKGIIFGRLAAGYFYSDYGNNDDVDRFDIEVDLAMNVTEKFTAGLEAGRNINQDNSFVQGFVDTNAAINLNYELQHNMYLGTRFSWSNAEFLGNQEGREEDTYSLGLNFRYIHSPYFESRVLFNSMTRDSTVDTEEFDQNYIGYSLTGRL